VGWARDHSRALEAEDRVIVDAKVHQQVNRRVEWLKVWVVDADAPALENDERHLATHDARLRQAVVVPLGEARELNDGVVGLHVLQLPQARRAQVRIRRVHVPPRADVPLLALLL
jgi:hypothetical protein